MINVNTSAATRTRRVATPALTSYAGCRGTLATLLFLASLLASFTAPAAALDPAISQWLAAQTNIQTWSADFVQTRTFKSLTEPLKATGHVWFSAPNRFRWELGHPPQTIAVRAPAELLVLYPKLKRVERYPLDRVGSGQWRDALALLEAGFPRNEAQLQAQYNIAAQSISNSVCSLTLEPKSAAARKMMPKLNIAFETNSAALHSTELFFADGSSLRNDFEHPVMNPPLEPSMFDPPIPSDYKVVEPMKGR